MKKIASMVLDVTDHVLAKQAKYLAEAVSNLSEQAKTASIHSIDEQRELDDENIALILFHKDLGEIPKYACDTPGITEINMQLLSEKEYKLPEEFVKKAANNLGYVAGHYNIDIPENLKEHQSGEWQDPHLNLSKISTANFHKKLANSTFEKTAHSKEYALPNQQKFDISDDGHVKVAVNYFSNARSHLTPEEKVIFASRVYKKARDIEDVDQEKLAELKPYAMLDLEKFGENFYPNIQARKNLTHNPKFQDVYDRILDDHETLGPIKTAEVLSRADDGAGMNRAIEKEQVHDVMLAVFGQKKEASFLDKLSQVGLTNYVDKYTAKELQGEDAEAVFQSLPDPTKKLLQEAIHEGK